MATRRKAVCRYLIDGINFSVRTFVTNICVCCFCTVNWTVEQDSSFFTRLIPLLFSVVLITKGRNHETNNRNDIWGGVPIATLPLTVTR